MHFKNIHIAVLFAAYAMTVTSSPINSENSSNDESIIDEVIDGIKNIKNGIFGKKSVDTSKSAKNVDADDLCLTPECIKTSSFILDNIDPEVDPCEDFYQFTCGNFIKNSVIEENEYSTSSFNDIAKENQRILQSILDGDYVPSKNMTSEQANLDKKNFEKVKDFYNTCMDVDTIDSKGKEPLTNLLNQLEINKNKDSYNTVDGLTDLVIKLHSNSINSFFAMGVAGDYNDPTKNIIQLTQSSVSLGTKEYYASEEVTAIYKDVIKSMLSTMFKEEDESGNFITNLFTSHRDYDKLANSIVEFEAKLANVALTNDERHNPKNTYNPLNLKTLNEKYPFINWTTYLQNVFEAHNVKIQLNDNSLINIISLNYFNTLNTLLKETDTDTLSAYAEWRTITLYGDYISKDAKEPLIKLNNLLTGQTGEPKRSETCIDYLQSLMGMALGKLYIDAVFSDEIRGTAGNMIKNIQEALTKRIPEMQWLDDQTREKALGKLKTMKNKIGYPDYIMNPVELDKEYQGLTVVKDDFFNTIRNSFVHSETQNLKDAYQPVDKSKWLMPPSMTDAYYYQLTNDINFPAGILRYPFLKVGNPEYLNYGSMGTVIGHEMTHAFDNNGKEYDANGKYENWWTNSTTTEFNKLAKCFVDQYGSYSIQGPTGEKVNLNGEMTLGENLADNAGLTRAYEAWQSSLKNEKGNNKLIPGLTEYTKEQLFFISFGQIWCSKSRPEIEVLMARANEHSLPKFRVNGSVSNSKNFAEAFKCKTNSPMNPDKKCLIW